MHSSARRRILNRVAGTLTARKIMSPAGIQMLQTACTSSSKEYILLATQFIYRSILLHSRNTITSASIAVLLFLTFANLQQLLLGVTTCSPDNMSDYDIQHQHDYELDHYNAQGTSSYNHSFQPVSQSIDLGFSSKQWKPSLFGSVPLTGFVALVVAVLSTAGIVAALYSANGKAIDSWPTENRPIQLTVLLAILIAMANVGLGAAFQEGRTLTWWIRMSKGATLEESQRYWEHGSSALQAVWGLFCWRPNRVTLVSILMAVTFINGPLIQRAVRITSETSTYPSTFHAALSTDQTSQPTAYYMTRAHTLNALATNFSRVLLAYTNRDPIEIDLHGCKGSCEGVLIGAGFDVDCARTSMDYSIDLGQDNAGRTWRLGTISILFDGFAPFGDASMINLNSTYKGSADAEGQLTVINCTLHSAVVQYPFSYLNGTITLRGSITSVDEIVNPHREAPLHLARNSRSGKVSIVARRLFLRAFRHVLEHRGRVQHGHTGIAGRRTNALHVHDFERGFPGNAVHDVVRSHPTDPRSIPRTGFPHRPVLLQLIVPTSSPGLPGAHHNEIRRQTSFSHCIIGHHSR